MELLIAFVIFPVILGCCIISAVGHNSRQEISRQEIFDKNQRRIDADTLRLDLECQKRNMPATDKWKAQVADAKRRMEGTTKHER